MHAADEIRRREMENNRMPRLLLKLGAGQGIFYDIAPGTTIIGRSRNCTVQVRSFGVSRNHAAIRYSPGRDPVLEDMGSKNGTFLNGTRIEKASLSDGDEIGIGPVSFVYQSDGGEGTGGAAVACAPPHELTSTVRSVLKVRDAKEDMSEERIPSDPDLLSKAHRYLTTVYRVGHTLSSTLDFDEVLSAVMEIVFEVIHPDEAFIMLKDDDTGEFKLRLFRSKLSSGKQCKVAVSRTILKKVQEECVAILSADASTDDRFKAARSVMRYHMMSTMCVPLVSKGEILGVLHVANRISSGEFQQDDLELLSGIAAQAALAIANAKLYRDIQREVRNRNNLQRYLSPNAVEQIIHGEKELNLGGEIKEVTVLFSDIRAFTRLSEELPPDEVVRMLNEYFGEMTNIVFRNDGSVDKFVGDALIVVFGAAFPRPDDPLRAVKTALDMQAAMRELNGRWSSEGRRTFRIGIGITTGKVLYGNVGSEQRMELTVIGDAVNLAARLASVAKGGEILVSGFTWKALGGAVRGERMSPLRIRGKAEPVEVYRLARASSAGSPPEA